MASADTLCRKLLNVKNTVVESHSFYNDADGVIHLRIKAHPNAWHQDECPFCGKRNLPRYDRQAKNYKVPRSLDFAGILVEIEAPTHRVTCPEHGRPKADDKVAAKVQAARTRASEIKNSGYTLGKAPEHLTEKQQAQLDMIQANDPQLYRAYCLKESRRLLLKSTDVKQAEADLKHWFWWTSHSRIPAFKELNQKIKRHKEHILNTIRLGLSNARIEATNNKIKLIIRKAYGFRNIQNMMDMVYLVCSDIRIPLPSRKSEPQKAA